MKQSPSFEAETGHEIKTWGRVGTENAIMGVWGEFVSVDFDICVADGACIDACPVGVNEFAEFPGNAASDKKPLMPSPFLFRQINAHPRYSSARYSISPYSFLAHNNF